MPLRPPAVNRATQRETVFGETHRRVRLLFETTDRRLPPPFLIDAKASVGVPVNVHSKSAKLTCGKSSPLYPLRMDNLLKAHI